MKYCIIISALLCCTGLKAQTFTLKECIETAIRNNIEVKQAEWQSEVDRANWKQTRANQVPFLITGITHGINQGRNIDPFTNSYVNQEINYANYSINSNLVLWNGSNLSSSTKRDALNYEAGKMELQQAKDNITINVILAYLQVLNNEEQFSLLKQQTVVTKQQVDRLEVLNRQGAIAPALYYDLKGQLATDQLNEINARNDLELSKLTLARLMNIDYSTSMQLQKITVDQASTLYYEQPETIYQLAAQELAIIKAAQFRKQSASKETTAAKGSRWPSLILSGGLGTNYSSAASTLQLVNITDVESSDYVIVNGVQTPVYTPKSTYASNKIEYFDQWKNNFNSGLSLGLRIPLFNAAQARTRINLAKIQEKRAEFELQTAKTELKQTVQQSHLNMVAAYERLMKLQQQVDDFTQSFQAAEARLQAGAGTSIDYIIAKNNLDRARGNLVAARYDYYLRTKVLDFYQGRLTY